MDDLFGLKLQSLSITCPFSPDNQQACKKCPKGTYMPDKQAIQCIPLRGKHRSISIIPYTSYPNATNGTAIGLPIRPGVVPGGSMCRHIFQFHGAFGSAQTLRSQPLVPQNLGIASTPDP